MRLKLGEYSEDIVIGLFIGISIRIYQYTGREICHLRPSENSIHHVVIIP